MPERTQRDWAAPRQPAAGSADAAMEPQLVLREILGDGGGWWHFFLNL